MLQAWSEAGWLAGWLAEGEAGASLGTFPQSPSRQVQQRPGLERASHRSQAPAQQHPPPSPSSASAPAFAARARGRRGLACLSVCPSSPTSGVDTCTARTLHPSVDTGQDGNTHTPLHLGRCHPSPMLPPPPPCSYVRLSKRLVVPADQAPVSVGTFVPRGATLKLGLAVLLASPVPSPVGLRAPLRSLHCEAACLR